MHNWWIAALEHFGLITHEEAEHISNEIKNSIHKEKYSEALEELDAILARGKFNASSTIDKLETEIAGLRAKVDTLSKPSVAKPIAQKTKVS